MNLENMEQKYKEFIEEEKKYFTFSEETLNNFFEKLMNEFNQYSLVHYKEMAKAFFDIYLDYDDDLYSLSKFFDELFLDSEVNFSNEKFQYFPMYGFEKKDNLINTYIPTNIINREAYSNIKVDCISLVSYKKIRVPKDSFIICSKINNRDYAFFVSKKEKLHEYFSYKDNKNHILIPQDNILPHGDLYSYSDDEFKYFEITNTPKKNYQLYSSLDSSLDVLNLRFSENHNKKEIKQTKISEKYGDVFGYWISPEKEIIPVYNFQGHDDLAIRVLREENKEKSLSNKENMMNNGWIHITYIDEYNSKGLSNIERIDPKMMICISKNMENEDNLKIIRNIIAEEKPTYGVLIEFHNSENQLENEFLDFDDYKLSLKSIQARIRDLKLYNNHSFKS